MTFEPTEESLCFLRGPLEWMTEAKSINVSYIIDLKEHVIVKSGNCSEEIVSTRLYVKFRREKRCLVKHFSFLKTFAINIEMLSVK